MDAFDPVMERPAIVAIGFAETPDVQLIPSFQKAARIVELPTARKLLDNVKLPAWRKLVTHMQVCVFYLIINLYPWFGCKIQPKTRKKI